MPPLGCPAGGMHIASARNYDFTSFGGPWFDSRHQTCTCAILNRACFLARFLQGRNRVVAVQNQVPGTFPSTVSNMLGAARLQPGCCQAAARLSSVRPNRRCPASQAARPPVHPRRQTVTCTAEHLQAAVESACQCPTAAPAAAAPPAWWVEWFTLSPRELLLVFVCLFIWGRLDARKKKIREEYEEMLKEMHRMRYPWYVVARVEAMTPQQFNAAAKAAGSRNALLIRWLEQGPQVGCCCCSCCCRRSCCAQCP